MTKRIKTGFAFIFFLAANMVLGQNYEVEYLTSKDGLAQDAVRSIVKDKYGFMWFGTWNGLCRYDGYSFKTYKNIPGDTCSLANSRVHTIFKDKDGILWIATFNFLVSRYNYETDDFTNFSRSELSNALKSSLERPIGSAIIKNIPEKVRKSLGHIELSNTREHLVLVDNPLKLSDRNINCLFYDNSNILWVGTASGGVNKVDFNENAFKIYPSFLNNEENTKNPVRCILADGSTIWAGTQSDGLHAYSPDKDNSGIRVKNTDGKYVKAIIKDNEYNIWLGCRDGLWKYVVKEDRLINYFQADKSGKQYNRFSSIAENPSDSSLWFGTFNSVLRYNPGTNSFEEIDLSPYFRNSNAVSLLFDSNSNFWIGTETDGAILLVKDHNTNSWKDTILYDSKSPVLCLPDNRVYSITEDQNKNIWIGTANGLVRFDPQTKACKLFSEKDGLADQYITKLLSDTKGKMWISHKKGISCIDINDLSIKNYAVSHKGFEFVEGSGDQNVSEGILYFGGINGFVSFRPDSMVKNEIAPDVVLTNLEVLNQTVEIGSLVQNRVILNKPLYLSDEITLTSRDKSFSIEFAALHYSNPNENKYAYMLDGYDEAWINTTATRRIVSYANMPPGEYTFKVKAANNDGVWNPNPASLKITILPPWWMTWQAYCLYFFVFSLIIWTIYRIMKIKQTYNRRILVAQLNEEKAKEIENLRTRFFTNISHEVRTPLTLLIDPLERLMVDDLPPKEVNYFHRIMQKNVNRLLVLVNQLLDFRKIETGNYTVSASRGDIVQFLQNSTEAYFLKADENKIQFSFDSDQEEFPFFFDSDIVDKVINNLLSNAFKHTPSEGKITVSLHCVSNLEIVIRVSDNGEGFDDSLKEKIFDPFYQDRTVTGNRENSSGLGLALIKELVQLHKGAISATSQPNVETTFEVHLQALEAESSKLIEPQATTSEEMVINLPESERNKESSLPLIQIIEDDDDVRAYLVQTLQKQFRVMEAENGRSGLELAREQIPDMVISDINMPEMDGLELCKMLKTDQRTSHIPVILLTARQSDSSFVEGYETGADDYIVKPFKSPVLIARINNLLESRTRLRSLFGKDFNFDPQKVVVNSTDKDFVNKAVEFVESHLLDPNFGVDQLSELLNMSRTPLYLKVKALTGQTVHEFISTIRLNKAAELLWSTDMTIAEISYQTGFSSPGNLTRSFTKQFEISPSGYRSKH